MSIATAHEIAERYARLREEVGPAVTVVVATKYVDVGELAVLRDAPRAATVMADPPGVRGLVIGGEAVRALLVERPEAAMAMLATLAERISQQR